MNRVELSDAELEIIIGCLFAFRPGWREAEQLCDRLRELRARRAVWEELR